jgi:catechol 2,3-dioxygenase-like lactoylglutathione lyase family enzyme
MARSESRIPERSAQEGVTTIHLGVADVKRSATFYEAFLGGHPRLRERTMVVFELAAPPLVLMIFAHPEPEELAPVCYALDVPKPQHVGATAVALRRIGARLRLQDAGIEVCDPDGNLWKIRFAPREREMAVVRIWPAGSPSARGRLA